MAAFDRVFVQKRERRPLPARHRRRPLLPPRGARDLIAHRGRGDRGPACRHHDQLLRPARSAGARSAAPASGVRDPGGASEAGAAEARRGRAGAHKFKPELPEPEIELPQARREQERLELAADRLDRLAGRLETPDPAASLGGARAAARPAAGLVAESGPGAAPLRATLHAPAVVVPGGGRGGPGLPAREPGFQVRAGGSGSSIKAYANPGDVAAQKVFKQATIRPMKGGNEATLDVCNGSSDAFVYDQSFIAVQAMQYPNCVFPLLEPVHQGALRRGGARRAA